MRAIRRHLEARKIAKIARALALLSA